MPSILGRFSKQTAEILDYDVDYTDWFVDRGDTPSTHTTTADAGITVVSSVRTGKVIKVILSGGMNGETYKTTLRLTTSSGVVKEADFTVKIKDV